MPITPGTTSQLRGDERLSLTIDDACFKCSHRAGLHSGLRGLCCVMQLWLHSTTRPTNPQPPSSTSCFPHTMHCSSLASRVWWRVVFGGESCQSTFNRVGKTRAAVEMQGGRSFTCQVLLLLLLMMMMMMMPSWIGGDAPADASRFQSKIPRFRLLLQ